MNQKTEKLKLKRELKLYELVTFKENIDLPVYNWFYFKEGYSKSLINWLIKKYKLKETILDPFCGSGTTLLAAKEAGLKSIGFDLMPLSVLASKVKTRNYKIRDLEKIFNELKTKKFKETNTSRIDKRIRKLFYSKNLEKVIFYFNEIKKIKNEKNREFFLLALISITGKASNTIKKGGSLRKTKKHFVNVKKLFLGKAKKMINDLKKFKQDSIEPEIFFQDARTFNIEKESISSIITSPPYLNKIEYTKIYKIELGLFFNQKQALLKSFLGDKINKVYSEFSGMPLIAQAYFNDMKKVLVNSFNALKMKGKMIIVVAGGCFPDKVIQSDEIIINLAEKTGFKLIERITARQINCMLNRTKLIGKTRESIIVLEK